MSFKIKMNTAPLKKFSDGMQKLRSDPEAPMREYLEKVGEEFLALVVKNIAMFGAIDSEDLYYSFFRGEESNVWEMNGLKLVVGSSVPHAGWVHEGHMTVKSDTPGAFRLSNGELARFVPGWWDGDKFRYDPGAEGGMILKAKWVDGVPYLEMSENEIKPEKMAAQILEKHLKRCFG